MTEEWLDFIVSCRHGEPHNYDIVIGAMANELTKTSDEAAEEVKTLLGLNNRQVLVELLTLGYEEDPKPAKKYRKDAREVVFYEKIQ